MPRAATSCTPRSPAAASNWTTPSTASPAPTRATRWIPSWTCWRCPRSTRWAPRCSASTPPGISCTARRGRSRRPSPCLPCPTRTGDASPPSRSTTTTCTCSTLPRARCGSSSERTAASWTRHISISARRSPPPSTQPSTWPSAATTCTCCTPTGTSPPAPSAASTRPPRAVSIPPTSRTRSPRTQISTSSPRRTSRR